MAVPLPPTQPCGASAKAGPNEVNVVDFAPLSYLRVSYPAVVRELPIYKAELTGTEITGDDPTPTERSDR